MPLAVGISTGISRVARKEGGRGRRENERGERKLERRGQEKEKEGWENLTFALRESESLLSFHFSLKHTCELENDSVPREKLTHKSKAQAEPASPPPREAQPACTGLAAVQH